MKLIHTWIGKDLTLRTLTLRSLLLPFWRRFLHPDWWPLCGQGLWGLHEPGSVGEELSSLAFASAWSADCFNSIGWWLHLWVAIHLECQVLGIVGHESMEGVGVEQLEQPTIINYQVIGCLWMLYLKWPSLPVPRWELRWAVQVQTSAIRWQMSWWHLKDGWWNGKLMLK